MVGAGLVLLTRATDSGSYWTQVLPGRPRSSGSGLAVTVAPLTATAMGAAPAEHSGIASAVNNVVARAAGLLAVAILPLLAGLTGAAALEPHRAGRRLPHGHDHLRRHLCRRRHPRRADHPQPAPLTDAPVPRRARCLLVLRGQRPAARAGAGGPAGRCALTRRAGRPRVGKGRPMPRTARPAVPQVFSPATLGPLTLRNRIIKAATFEGVMPGGQVSDQLVDFHRRVAAGGAAMSTVAYLAVSPEGRTDRHCLLLDEATVPGLRRLTDAVHAEGAAAAAQIGHAGPVANARSNGAPALSPSGASRRWARGCTPSTWPGSSASPRTTGGRRHGGRGRLRLASRSTSATTTC